MAAQLQKFCFQYRPAEMCELVLAAELLRILSTAADQCLQVERRRSRFHCTQSVTLQWPRSPVDAVRGGRASGLAVCRQADCAQIDST